MKTKNIFDSLPAICAPKAADLRDELDRYLSTDPEHTDNVLLWWAKRKMPIHAYLAWRWTTSQFPVCTLSCVTAIPVLTSIVATSVDVERVFSKGRILLSHVRNRLSVQSTWALMCLGAWS